MTEETLVWKGTPSQAINFGTYVVCVLLCWLVVPIFIFIWKWMEVRATVYELTTERLKMTSGLFTKKFEEIELYRVRDISMIQPFWYRLFGAGNITLLTADVSTPDVLLQAIPQPQEVREHLRQCVETVRQRKHVRAVEYD